MSISVTPLTNLAIMDKIEIKGYKSFKDLTLYLNPINILIGSNGSGKSNFLSFFEFLNRMYEQKLTEYVAISGGVDKFFFQGSKVTDTIYANIKFQENSYLIELKEGDGKFVLSKECIGYNDDYYEIGHFNNESNIKSYNGLQRGDYIKRYLSEIKKYHFHDTGKSSPFTKESNMTNDVYYLYEKGENIAAFLYGIQQNAPIVYKRIVKTIQSVAPYFSDFYFNVSTSDTVRLLWTDKYSSTVYGPTDLSDGTIRFIALATLFLQPNLPKVIIIDEPELGLHPFASQKLSGMIKSAAAKGTQIIIATQSADLISNFNAEDIITVNQINGVSVMKRLEQDSLNAWLEEYTLGDLWKQNILKGGQPL